MHDQKLNFGVVKFYLVAILLPATRAVESLAPATANPGFNGRRTALWLSSLLLCLSTLLSLPASGQDTEPGFDYYKEPGQYPTRSYLNQSFSEHIDLFGGRLQHHYVDLFIPGNGAFDLKIQRSYTNPDEAGPGEPTPFGIGWNMHFGRVLRRANVALCFVDVQSGADMPVLELPDGSRQVLFRDDTYFPNQGRFITVNRWRAECMQFPTGMRVFAPDGTRYEMTQSANGNVPSGQQGWYTTKITDRNDNSMAITYQSFGGLMVPVTLSTSDGRTVTLSYDSDANGTRLRSISDGTRVWNYGLTFVPTVGWFLSTVTPPAGGAWQYGYNTAGGTPGLRAMTSVTYPQGGVINYSYLPSPGFRARCYEQRDLGENVFRRGHMELRLQARRCTRSRYHHGDHSERNDHLPARGLPDGRLWHLLAGGAAALQADGPCGPAGDANRDLHLDEPVHFPAGQPSPGKLARQ